MAPAKELQQLLSAAIAKDTRANGKNYGLLFSGGVDSCLLALLLQRRHLDFTCFFAYVKDSTKAKDLEFAKSAAKALGLKLEIASCNREELSAHLPEILQTIGTFSPVQVSVAVPLYLSCRKAKKKKIDILFSGLGSDELFAGYHKFKNTKNIRKQTEKCLESLKKEDLKRDSAISKCFGLRICHPFLDKQVIEFALSLPEKQLLTAKQNKIIVRNLARDLGLPSTLVERKKLACQYGCNSDKAIEKLAKEKKLRTKTDFLLSFKKEKIAVLYSGGKDSNLSLWLEKRRGNEISCLVSIVPENNDSYMFQKPDIGFLKQQATALGIPLIFRSTKGEKEKELKDLKLAIALAKKRYKITTVVAGALCSNYQKQRIERLCCDLGLKLSTPLWHMNEEEEIQLLLDNGFKAIICKIAALGLSENLLGKIINRECLDMLKKLNVKYGVNIAGEGGEYETLVLDGPTFKQSIRILASEKVMKNEFTGVFLIKESEILKK